VADDIPDRLFVGRKPGSQQVDRVDPGLQKMARAPRLLAVRLEALGIHDLALSHLDGLLGQMLNTDPPILGFIAAF